MQPNILSAVIELRLMLKTRPDLIDRGLIKKGREVISYYFDENFGSSISNFSETKKKLIHQAILDLSSGAPLLKSCRMGITYSKGIFSDFTVPYAEKNPGGDLVATIGLKSVKAFDRHRKENDTVLAPDEINSAIYFLISELAML